MSRKQVPLRSCSATVPARHRGRWQCLVVVLLAIWSIRPAVAADRPSTPHQRVHHVRLNYAALGQTRATLQDLVECRSDKPATTEFYCDTKSVFCADGQCRDTIVRIVWDELGRYRRFELRAGAWLEKSGGKRFTRADYQKLDAILRDADSPLRNMTLVTLQNERDDGASVDAVATATPGYFRGAVVEGAAWTCLTLWHCANGEITSVIRRLTALHYRLTDLHRIVLKGNLRYRMFAIEQLMARKAYDHATLATVLKCAARADAGTSRLIVKYAERAPADTYFDVVGQLFAHGLAMQRLMALNSLLRMRHVPPTQVLDQFAQQLASCKSYQEIDLVLRLMEKHQVATAAAIDQAMKLLDRANPLIARRAYWFLSKLPVSSTQQQRLDAFRRAHADIL